MPRKTKPTRAQHSTAPIKVVANQIPDQIIINSLDDLNKVHRQEMDKRNASRFDGIKNAMVLRNELNNQIKDLKTNQVLTGNLGASDLIRTEYLRFLMDGPRDIDAECGYVAWLTPDHYRTMYDREGIGKRVVDCEPEETWSMDPEVFEDEDEQTETEFEKAWEQLLIDENVWNYLLRTDILSGIGQYGILLFGIDDGKDLAEPIDGFNDDGTVDDDLEYKILYMRPFSEEVVFIKTRETDMTSARYGLPKMYRIMFRDFPNWGIQAGQIINRDVHWSRVLHVADNPKNSEIFGIPRMQQVWNRLYDLRKLYAASAEGFWKAAFPGLVFETLPEVAEQGIPIDKKGMSEEVEKYWAGLQRYLAVEGVSVKSLPPQIADPTNNIEIQLKAIAIAKGIPYRVLFGSEEAKLAGNQDARAWNKRIAKRQAKYVSPMIIRPFVDRMIDYGVLPRPKQYLVEWPDLNSPTDQDKAAIALQRSQAMVAYVNGGSGLMAPREFLTLVMGFTGTEADQIIKSSGNFNSEDEENPDITQQADDEAEEPLEGQQQEQDENSEGNLGASVPDDGSTLKEDSLSGKNTIGKAKRVESTFVQQPDLNSAGKTKVNGNGRHRSNGRHGRKSRVR